jgi:hypothetical protein
MDLCIFHENRYLSQSTVAHVWGDVTVSRRVVFAEEPAASQIGGLSTFLIPKDAVAVVVKPIPRD